MPRKASTQLGGIANLALIAPVRGGFIPGADTFTYAKRLEMFFKTLNAIRLASRESSLTPNPFPDALGRWGILHSFRYALIPPEIGSAGEPPKPDDRLSPAVYRLYLNVTFDGGWEPYMRVIYRDLGAMLDAIFCNCVGYPSSAANSFDAYSRWVRGQEVPAGIFYTESSKSSQDLGYLENVERTYRQGTDLDTARQAVSKMALPPAPAIWDGVQRFAASDAPAKRDTVANNLRALKGLYDLRSFYAENTDGDAWLLHRFARDAMPEFRALLPALRADPMLAPLLGLYPEPVRWLLADVAPPTSGSAAAPRGAANFDVAQVQSGILSPYAGVTHGCLCLIAILDVAEARTALRKLPELQPTTGNQPLKTGAMYRGIAFTRQGLALLAPDCVDALPQEFIDGMEARAGLLGDLGHNHPDNWRRPTFRGSEIDLASVHIVVQWRFAATDRADDATLHPKLAAAVQALDAAGTGLRVLSAEAMRSYPEGGSAGHITREPFGFQDGFSQPSVTASPGQRWSDRVEHGELLLGYPNDRGGGIFPAQASSLLDNGSFLVIRKIRQDVAHWNRVLRDAASDRDPGFAALGAQQQRDAMNALAAKLMGRELDGKSLADPSGPASGNDFDFSADADGSRCPFQSHTRRANPRNKTGAKAPRMIRRGMSYGPRASPAGPVGEQGLYFMAYCGSIAEQFEVIQRWIAGGNSSGVLAAHSDPLLGVAQRGVARSFQWWDASRQCVARIDLGDRPLTLLEWGLYLFVPSVTGLRALTKGARAKNRSSDEHRTVAGEDYAPDTPAFHDWQRLLQDRATRDQTWRRVKQNQGDLQTAYGRLVSNPDTVMEMLQDGNGKDPLRYSVCGYGRRFHASIGDGYLGMDPDSGHTAQAVTSGINAAVVKIDEETAYRAAAGIAERLLIARTPVTGTPIPVDIAELTENVLAALCTEWFGLPEGVHMKAGISAGSGAEAQTGYCPRDFVKVARHVFGAHPSPTESEQGIGRGKVLQQSVKAYLASTPRAALVGLSAVIATALHAQGPDVVAQTIAGIMLGFAPSVHGNFVSLMRAWVEERETLSLWDLQVLLLDLRAGQPDIDGYDAAREVLRRPLLDQMRREPLPATVWREPVGAVPAQPGQDPDKIVIGLHGLMQYENIDDAMLFGGTQPGGPGPTKLRTVHACPGYGMAVGVLMGIIAAILSAGTLRSTPSPTILKIIRPPA